MSESYCCLRFMESVSRGTERGLAIVPRRYPRIGDGFFLQFRAVAENYDGVFRIVDDIPITLFVEQAIQFCPWCGKRLADYYSGKFDDLPFVEEDTEP